MLISSLWPVTGSLPIAALSDGVVVSKAELLEASASGTAADMLPVSSVETVPWDEAVNIQPAELSKTTSDVIANIKKQLCLFIFTGSI
jgi:hypothetical protein